MYSRLHAFTNFVDIYSKLLWTKQSSLGSMMYDQPLEPAQGGVRPTQKPPESTTVEEMKICRPTSKYYCNDLKVILAPVVSSTFWQSALRFD